MTPIETVALAVSVLTAVGLALKLFVWPADVRRAELETVDELRAALTRVHRELREERDRSDDFEKLLAAATENATRLEHLVKLLADGLDYDGLIERFSLLKHELCELLDLVETPMVITSDRDGGTFTFCNKAFCAVLGLPLQEILRRGWRDLVDEAHLESTRRVEARAHDGDRGGLVDVVNVFVGARGRVRLRWWALTYHRHTSLAVVRVEEQEADQRGNFVSRSSAPPAALSSFVSTV